MTDKKKQDSLISTLYKIAKDYPGGDNDSHIHSSSYKSLLDSLNVKAPANYATHHSIANEWAIIRWIELIKWGDNKPEIKDKSILDQLYFKYLAAKVTISDGEREIFDKKYKKKNPTSPIISGIEGKKIIYFDDEGDKGWYSLLKCIFKESKAELIPYSIDKSKTLDQMLQDAKSFADKNPGDCYLIDLRLHDDDFGTDVKPEELSGYRLADYIKNDKEKDKHQRCRQKRKK